jgi:alanine racemase
MVDVTRIDDIAVGDEAVLLGSQGNEAIRASDLERMTGLERLEIMPRLARSLPRTYLGDVEPSGA